MHASSSDLTDLPRHEKQAFRLLRNRLACTPGLLAVACPAPLDHTRSNCRNSAG